MVSDFEPSYLALVRSGELASRVKVAYLRLGSCNLCPRDCGVNRREEARGSGCRTGDRARVASYQAHFGEEAPLVGRHGSGTVFFAYCNMRCQYCQNYAISQLGHGEEVEPEQIATMMLALQADGCHNINLVTPSHVVPQILVATLIAAHAGLKVPLVYNTGGYDALDTLALLDGVVDIYMPDMKYSDADVGWQHSRVKDYPAINRAAVKEMHRQVGDLQIDQRGIATRGLLVRHLVLPNGKAGTAAVVRFLADEISPNTYLNIMDQYRPCYRADSIEGLSRRITREEFSQAVGMAEEAGLHRLDRRLRRPLGSMVW